MKGKNFKFKLFVLVTIFFNRQFVRKGATTSVGEKCLGTFCPGTRSTGRPCRGKLFDTILDWEANLPAGDLDMAEYHSR